MTPRYTAPSSNCCPLTVHLYFSLRINLKQILDIIHTDATESQGLGEGQERKREDGEEGAHVSRSRRGTATKEQLTRQAGRQETRNMCPESQVKKELQRKGYGQLCQTAGSPWDEDSDVMATFRNMVVMAGLVESPFPLEGWGQTCPEGVTRGSADMGH